MGAIAPPSSTPQPAEAMITEPEKVGLIQTLTDQIEASVEKVEAAAVPTMPVVGALDEKPTVSWTDSALSYVYELRRLIWPLLALVVILWNYEGLRRFYFVENTLEPAWLRKLGKIQDGLIGFLCAHITRSGAFPYVKLRYLYTTDKETFRWVFLTIILYYIGWIYSMAVGLG